MMMKRLLTSILFCAIFYISADAQRYVSEVFSNSQITYTPNIIYGNNFSFLTGSPVATDLMMDIYAPDTTVDPLPVRPLIIYMHTGSFLPAVVNGTPTGTRTDSATVEMCRQFARRGYVAAAMSYRLGWNPVATGPGSQDIRTGTLLNAVYRSIQDQKACVRYIYKIASTGNPYKIDTTAIVLGGQGSGGYLVLAYATLDKPSEINLPKFLADSTIPAYGYVQGQSYVNMAVSGDFDGHGGNASYNNDNNSNGYSTNVRMIFNLGGALGDSSWLEAGDVPMIAFHVMGDPFAPYNDGPVIVPTTGQFVVNVSGSNSFMAKANALGNNNCFINAGFSDPYTIRANQINGGKDGLFPFETNPAMQAGPWEWFDLQSTRNYAQALGYPPSQGDTVYNNALITNPNMSKAKALAYIDTIQNYLNPRIVYCLGLTGIHENANVAASISARPNPTHNNITFELRQNGNMMTGLELYDITGRRLINIHEINSSEYKLDCSQLDAGIYISHINTINGEATIRVIVE